MNKESSTALLLDEQMGELATPLVRYLSKKVHNNEDANDLAQEAFLRMHKFQQSRRLDNARAFLFKTANNLVVDQMRRASVHNKYLSFERLPEQSDEENDKFAPSAERTVSAEQELDRIYKVVNQMPEKVRSAFLMHRGKDLSYSQIATEMDVSTSMVEKYIIQALRILRKEVN
ncbi:MAG: RNA polymerase sigma factor [Proteobacteria bacterium]|nr:RNA polymerase sigma factor [Pseudomonadota bacterium]